MPSQLVENLDALHAVMSEHLERQYEGTIIRDPNGVHKSGRSTVREGGLLRIKQFVEFEFIIEKIIEGEENTNEAKINALGQTERSSHQANMIPNGMVGALEGTVLADVKDLLGNVVITKGSAVRVGAGCMTHADRKRYFEDANLILGHIGKGKLFPKGIKDKPRFPTFQSLRMKEDMS
jgi:DNA ligase-1